MRKVFIFLFLIFMGATALCVHYFPEIMALIPLKSDQIVREKREMEAFLKQVELLSKAWHEGDSERLWKNQRLSCPKALGKSFAVGDDYLKCNPRFLLCLIEAKVSDLKLSSLDYTFVTPARTHLPNLPQGSYLFTFKLPSGKTLPVLFEDSCNEVFLPERIYKYGKGNQAFLWDNYRANLFIDKYPVSFLQVSEWAKASQVKIHLPETQEGLSHYATGLTQAQMEAYCAFRGKQLLSTEVFDAASFYPEDLARPNESDIQNMPYPWTRKKKLDEKPCFKFSSQECQQLSSYEMQGATWTGLALALGGSLEAFFNPYEREENLKASSSFFPFSSPWHQLGERAHWDGKDFQDKNFDWGKRPSPSQREDIKVSFRCMRKMYRDETR